MTLQKTKPTYHDLTKLMFTNGNPKTDKNLKIEELWEQGSVFSLRLILGSALVGFLLASISGIIVFLLYTRKKRAF